MIKPLTLKIKMKISKIEPKILMKLWEIVS